MSKQDDINERGNHQCEFTLGVGGWAEYTVHMTDINDKVRHDVTVPPGKVIPIIFLPGVMGSNLRMSQATQQKLGRKDDRAWRPDDLTSIGGGAGIVTGMAFGGWFTNASPAERQLNFDPNETEVDCYRYTEDKQRFDPQGAETVASDARHGNVPSSLSSIPPLLGQTRWGASKKDRNAPSAAQLARWRGWSEILFGGAYGEVLKIAEAFMNNIAYGGKVDGRWHAASTDGKPNLAPIFGGLGSLVRTAPTNFGATSGESILDADLLKISACWYPVHAMGYNFLKSNGDSAIKTAKRIRGLLKGYRDRGFDCSEVIIVTHSMGGLMARALMHPEYGNLLNDKDVKVLGVYHNVMPTTGAAAAYKRMRFGFQESYVLMAGTIASLFGVDGQHATAILANTPGPLELLPGDAYGNGWLKVKDWTGATVFSYPRPGEASLNDIYLKPDRAWWRLINPLWVNPAGIPAKKGGGMPGVHRRLQQASEFVHDIEKVFHPTKSYASYCASTERRSYGEVVFKIMDGRVRGAVLAELPPPATWQLLTDDAKGTLTVQAGPRILTLRLEPPDAPGDETVPALRSAGRLPGVRFVHGNNPNEGYEHQNSYAMRNVHASLLYSLVQIAKGAKWEK